jgi:flagellar protein FliS
MPTYARALDSYQRTQVQASTPLEQVVMLYDAAMRFMGDARSAIERKDIPARRQAISRTLAIVGELRSTLDMNRGGEIASSLDELYGYVMMRLLDGAMHQDVKAIDDASRVVDTLRDAWRTIAQAATASGSAA